MLSWFLSISSKLTFVLTILSIRCLEGTTQSTRQGSWTHQNIGDVCYDSHICGHDYPPLNLTQRQERQIQYGHRVVSCCKECSCDTSCGQNNSCCFPDLDSYHLLNKTGQTCTNLITDGLLDEYQLQDYKATYVVTENPPDGCKYSLEYIAKTGIDINAPCGSINISPWGSLLPLFSRKSKMIYKNLHCSECHGATDAYLLNGTLNCERYDYVTKTGEDDVASHTQILNTIQQFPHCFLHFSFNENDDLKGSDECFPGKLIDTCKYEQFEIPDFINMTHAEIIAACESKLYSPFRRQFANVFCSMCNTKITTTITICTENEDTNKVADENIFTSLLDMNFLRMVGSQARETKFVVCDETKAVSTNDTGCRTIFCPSGQLRYDDGICRYPIAVWKNTWFVVYIKLTLIGNISEIADVFVNIRNIHTSPYLVTPWEKRWRLEELYKSSDDSDEMKNIYFVLALRTYIRELNPDSFIQRDIVKALADSWNLRLDGHVYELRQELFDYSIICPDDTFCVAAMPVGLEPLALKDGEIMPISDRNSWSRGVDFPVLIPIFVSGNIVRNFKMVITKMYFCNQIELFPSEFSFIGSNKLLNYSRENKIMFDGQFALVADTHGNTVPRICIEDSRFFTPNNSPNSVKELKWNLSIFAVALVLSIAVI